jgi:hypothetical protein
MLVAECRGLGGVEWKWQAADGMLGKARFGVEIGEQMGRTSACDRDPPGDRWHRRGLRCGKGYSDFLDFFVFIDSRNR